MTVGGMVSIALLSVNIAKLQGKRVDKTYDLSGIGRNSIPFYPYTGAPFEYVSVSETILRWPYEAFGRHLSSIR